ncbi:MAG: DUF2569 family protein [Candidatus Pacearchaeota archaeon]|nr:DUF2569 family protein [Candidatus Pacearchaeota archaeon]
MPFCAQCKRPITIGDPFCKNCGRKLGKRPVSPKDIPEATTKEKRVQGLGGWLVLLQIGFYWSIFAILDALCNGFLNEPASSFALIYVIGYAILLPIAMVLFYGKRKLFPLFFIILLWVNFLYMITNGFSFPPLTDMQLFSLYLKLSLIGSVSSFSIAIIWTLYLTKSKRVKNTFVR